MGGSMKIRLTKRDLLEWLDTLADDDTPRITVRFTTSGRLMSIQVDGLEEWLWPYSDIDEINE